MLVSQAGSSSSRADKDGVSKPVGKPRGRRRDRDCQTCKLRSIKCDLNRPSCGQCVGAGKPCHGYPSRVVWMGYGSISETRANALDGLSSNTRPCQSSSSGQDELNGDALPPTTNIPGPPIAAAASASLLSTQGANISVEDQAQSSKTDQNSFIQPLVALCQDIIHLGGDALGKGRNRYLSPEVICLISRLRDFAQARIETHPEHTGGPSLHEIWESEDAARHRLDALVGLKETLAVANPFALIGIAAFAFFDVCDSGFGQWQRHLLGAKSLLDYHCTCREELDRLSEEVTGLTAMVARLVWFDTTGAIIRGTPDMTFDPWHREILNDDFFRTVGCPADTFNLFARVAAGDVATDAPGIYLCAIDQLLKLDQGYTDWNLSADAYRCAAVLAILSKVKDGGCPGAPIAAMITSAVDRTCRLLVALPPTSQFYIHLAVPAYLAGINTTTLEHCNIIRGYWDNCSHAGVRRYPDGLARCEDHWKANDLVS